MFYQDYDQYIEETHMWGKIHTIQKPTMFISTYDDPIIRPDLYPFKEFEGNPNVIGAFTKRGGHCGHISGGLMPYQWFPQPILEFLNFMEKEL